MVAFVRQSEATECGLAALCMIANYHGHRFDLAALRQRFSVSLKGATLRDLMRIADGLGLGSRALRCEPEHLPDVKAPAVLHWDLNHFVVLKRASTKGVIIVDPAKGEKKLSYEEVGDHFTGVVLELTPTKTFSPIEEKRRTRLADLWSSIVGLKRALLQLFVLSLVLQVIVLALPFYVQLTIDEAILREDVDLLTILAVSFGVLYILSALVEGFRSWIILVIGQSMTFQMAGNVLRHLMRLPGNYFEKRHVGDLTSRVGSVRPIQQTLTESTISAIIDGVMAISTGVLIFIYSWQLGFVVLLFAGLYAAITLGSFPLLRSREEKYIDSLAQENTFTIETIRASRPIKLFGREAQRESGWRNAYSRVINNAVSVGRYRISIDVLNKTLFGLQIIVVVYIAARQILAGELTLGMFFAFMAYRQNFSDRVTGFITQGVQFRMLGLHLERLSDIVHTESEDVSQTTALVGTGMRGQLTLEDVTFRYGSNEAPVFTDLNLAVSPGEFLAIIGPSGGGKSTLLKVMLGLVQHDAGRVSIDGIPLAAYGIGSYRAQVGVVMQDDALLSGSIADNIAFFDPDLDMARVREAASAAEIHDDIARMPMNYLSLIGDMGAALSGGQRQRLLIARALYRNPRMIFMDEGTANLDEASERKIADVIEGMPITRVIVAHRPELIRRADRVMRMAGGELEEVSPQQIMTAQKV